MPFCAFLPISFYHFIILSFYLFIFFPSSLTFIYISWLGVIKVITKIFGLFLYLYDICSEPFARRVPFTRQNVKRMDLARSLDKSNGGKIVCNGSRMIVQI